MNEIINQIVNIGLDAVASIVLIAIGVLFAWIELKIGTNQKLSNINKAKNELKDAADQTVGALKQVFADTWKEANGGKLTDEQKAKLRAEVVLLTMEKMSAPSLKVLEGAKVDAVAYLKDEAEAFIERLNSGELIALGEIVSTEE